MADNPLKQEADRFRGLNHSELGRPQAGEYSVQGRIDKAIGIVEPALGIMLDNAEEIESSRVNEAAGKLRRLNTQLERLSELSAEEFPSKAKEISGPIVSFAREFAAMRDPFELAMLRRAGLMGNIHDLERVIADAVRNAKAEITSAAQKAKKIDDRAEETAKGVALQEVQRQFHRSDDHHRRHSRGWLRAGVAMMLIFVGAAALFAWNIPHGMDSWSPSAVYESLFRLVLLGTIALFLRLCFRLMSAHAHLRERAIHRRRLANAAETLMDVARTDEQRDAILGKIVDAMTDFGASGLVQNDVEQMNPSRITVDTVHHAMNSQTAAQQ